MPDILTLREIVELEKVCAAADANTVNLRWEPWDAEDGEDFGDLVAGEEGCSDYNVIAQAVSREMGAMLVNDVVSHDTNAKARAALPAALATIRRLCDAAIRAMNNDRFDELESLLIEIAGADGIEPAGPD